MATRTKNRTVEAIEKAVAQHQLTRGEKDGGKHDPTGMYGKPYYVERVHDVIPDLTDPIHPGTYKVRLGYPGFGKAGQCLAKVAADGTVELYNFAWDQ